MARDRLIPMGYFDDLADARKTLREDALVALERQLDLLSWLDTVTAQESYRDFMRAYGYKKLTDQSQREVMGDTLRESVKRAVGEAQTFYVSRDMTELVSQAASALNPFTDEGLSPSEVPSPCGFVMFDHPLWVDADDEYDEARREPNGIPLIGFAWRDGKVGMSRGGAVSGTNPGIEYFLFTTPEDMATMLDDPDLAPAEKLRAQWGPLPIYDLSGWSYGRAWSTATSLEDEKTEDEHGRMLVAPVVMETRRIILSVFKLLNEKITVLESETPYRALRRRAQGILPTPGDVVVVKLRKEYNPQERYQAEHGDDEEKEPWYTHRFLVRGHWKKQSYGQGRAQYKIIWVMPYIKGPTDRPFVLKDRVYSLET